MAPNNSSFIRVLRDNAHYRRVATSAALSGVGDWMFGLALTVWVLQRTGSAEWVSVFVAARMAPYLLGAVGGVIADRFDRRVVLVTCDLVRGVLLTALSLLVVFDGPIALGAVLAALAAAATVPYRAAVVAITPTLVPAEQLSVANALEAALNQTAVFAGPALCALVLTVRGPAAPLAFDALTFFVSAAVLSRLPRRARAVAPPSTAPTSWRTDLREGVTTVRTLPGAIGLLVLLGLTTVGYGASLVTHAVLAEHRLGLSSSGAGYLAAAAALGGIVATRFIARAASTTHATRALVTGGMLLAAPFLALSVLHNPLLACLVMIPEGVGSVLVDVVSVTLWQRVVPAEKLGRVYGIQDSVLATSQLTGVLLAPFLMRTFGVGGAVGVIGVTIVAGILATRSFLPGGLRDRRTADTKRGPAPVGALVAA